MGLAELTALLILGPTPAVAYLMRDLLINAGFIDTDQVPPEDWAALLEQVAVQAAVHAADAAIAESIAKGAVMLGYSNALNEELGAQATDGAETATGSGYWGVAPGANAWRVRAVILYTT